MINPWWVSIAGENLAQGDLLPDCQMPVFRGKATPDEAVEESIQTARLIVVTQSCDLQNNKVEYVALCPVYTLDEFEAFNPRFKTKGRWEEVRKGRMEGLHLLAGPDVPDDNRSALVVDFGHIVSLPLAYLAAHAADLGDRFRLNSPFVEHYSQGFARFFMRVGLPSTIPAYR